MFCFRPLHADLSCPASYWFGEIGQESIRARRSEASSLINRVRYARGELARLSLQHPSLGLSKTASLLGYEDPNSFLRAFRMWEGITPGEWRAMEKGGLQQTAAGLTSPRIENAFRSPEIPVE